MIQSAPSATLAPPTLEGAPVYKLVTFSILVAIGVFAWTHGSPVAGGVFFGLALRPVVDALLNYDPPAGSPGAGRPGDLGDYDR